MINILECLVDFTQSCSWRLILFLYCFFLLVTFYILSLIIIFLRIIIVFSILRVLTKFWILFFKDFMHVLCRLFQLEFHFNWLLINYKVDINQYLVKQKKKYHWEIPPYPILNLFRRLILYLKLKRFFTFLYKLQRSKGREGKDRKGWRWWTWSSYIHHLILTCNKHWKLVKVF